MHARSKQHRQSVHTATTYAKLGESTPTEKSSLIPIRSYSADFVQSVRVASYLPNESACVSPFDRRNSTGHFNWRGGCRPYTTSVDLPLWLISAGLWILEEDELTICITVSTVIDGELRSLHRFSRAFEPNKINSTGSTTWMSTWFARAFKSGRAYYVPYY